MRTQTSKNWREHWFTSF